jgi:FKBP-type peptidyl-prolyl cis-trans isomerase FklB
LNQRPFDSGWTFDGFSVNGTDKRTFIIRKIMMITTRLLLAAGLGVALSLPAWAEDKPELKDPKQKMSYAIGMNVGNNIKRSDVELDLEMLTSAIKDVMAGRDLKLTEQQAKEGIEAYQQEMRTRRQESQRKMAEKNKKEGDAFLAENKKKPGVKTHMVALGGGTNAELQYKIIAEGTGEIPKSNDLVSVNYKGTLVNGKEFDSSAKHGGQPAKFGVNRVVRGWSEALQMMKTGSKWELYVPSTLAYGDTGYGPQVEPGSTLIFEVELVGVEAPQPPPTAQPLTSDIIRVPSAEELKAGAKIEVLKPEDVEKATRAATNKTDKKP